MLLYFKDCRKEQIRLKSKRRENWRPYSSSDLQALKDTTGFEITFQKLFNLLCLFHNCHCFITLNMWRQRPTMIVAGTLQTVIILFWESLTIKLLRRLGIRTCWDLSIRLNIFSSQNVKCLNKTLC